jgi:hypothetical protein
VVVFHCPVVSPEVDPGVGAFGDHTPDHDFKVSAFVVTPKDNLVSATLP